MSDYLFVTTGRISSGIKASKILLAGDWCDEVKEKLGANVSVETIDYPISSLDAPQIKVEIDQVFEILLPKITAAYNEVFGLNKNDRYYNIILGRWLVHFLHNIYEKREILNNASKKFEDISIESCGKSYALSVDSDDYSQRSYSSHDFNFRMYSGVAEFLSGIQKKYIDIDDPDIPVRASQVKTRETLKSGIQSFVCMVNHLFRRKMTLVVSPYYPSGSLYNALWFFLKSGGEIIHYKFLPAQPFGNGLDYNLRNALYKIIRSDSQNQLLHIASELLLNFIPLSFVEHFTSCRNEALCLLNKYLKMSRLFTANAMHTDEPFKYLVAESQPREVWITQHGAGYGFSDVQSSENYERKLADRYFTWGWGKDKLPHPKLSFAKCIRYKANQDIVFTFPTVTEYAGLLESFFIASHYQRTLIISDQILNQISPSVVTKVVLRQREKKGLRMYEPKVAVRKDNISSFHDSLKRARIHLSNHFGTPVLESLAINLPTIVVYDPTSHKLRSSAVPFFEELKKAQILFEDPLKAAHHLNSVYENIDEWWLSRETQAAVKSFCSQFAQSNGNWRNTWLNMLVAG